MDIGEAADRYWESPAGIAQLDQFTAGFPDGTLELDGRLATDADYESDDEAAP